MLTNRRKLWQHIVRLPAERARAAVVAVALELALVLTTGSLLIFSPNAQAQEETPDPNQGVLVASVQPDSPAAAAGIVRGDIIQSINGEPVDLVSELTLMLSEMAAGDNVTMTVLHGDEVLSLDATLGERGQGAYLGIVPCGTGPVGMGGQPFTMPGQPEMPQMPGMPQMPDMGEMDITPGARIVEVVPDSPAAEAGLQPGDVIVSVDGQELGVETDLADVISQYAPGDAITLTIQPSMTVTGEEQAPEEGDTEAEEPVETFDVVVELGENANGNAFLGVSYAPTFSPRFFQMPQPGMPQPEMPSEMPEGALEQEVVVMQVAPDSPAAEAGLQEGDVIVAVDGEPIVAPDQLVDIISQYAPGDAVVLTVRGEDGEEVDIEVTLDENNAGNAFLGVSISSMIRSEPSSDDESFAPSLRFRGLLHEPV